MWGPFEVVRIFSPDPFMIGNCSSLTPRSRSRCSWTFRNESLTGRGSFWDFWPTTRTRCEVERQKDVAEKTHINSRNNKPYPTRGGCVFLGNVAMAPVPSNIVWLDYFRPPLSFADVSGMFGNIKRFLVNARTYEAAPRPKTWPTWPHLACQWAQTIIEFLLY